MATSLNAWLGKVPRYFTVVEIVDNKRGDAKWRVIRLSFLAVISLFIVLMLFLCNAAVYELYYGRGGFWGSGEFGSDFLNCPDGDAEVYMSPRSIETLTLPRGIVKATSDLEPRHLWEAPNKAMKSRQNLLAMPVGIKQKSTVDKIVQKFPADNFTVMLFHYDGKVDNWTDLAWAARAIHVMVYNQTKWWFAKRFLHPDVVAKYNYIFLWDEDIGVEHFHAGRYLDIMEDEGFEISQPALHRNSSQVHHRLTMYNSKVRAHRRINQYTARVQCDAKSTGPPCTGWVEMMAPVFSRAAWRCTWNMIQNDLVHAWGLDYKFGYCAQGTRSEKIGIIDAEFIVHAGIPSLGGPKLKKTAQAEGDESLSENRNSLDLPPQVDVRQEIRNRARVELDAFARLWRRSAANDPEWEDPYKVVPHVEVPSEQRAVVEQDVKPTKKKKGNKAKKSATKALRRIL